MNYQLTCSLKVYKIIDFESFDNFILYYFKCGYALPESNLNIKNYNTLKTLLSVSYKEKHRQCLIECDKIKKLLDKI